MVPKHRTASGETRPNAPTFVSGIAGIAGIAGTMAAQYSWTP